MNNSRIIDKNAHVNVIYSLEQVNYISFGVGIVYYLSCEIGRAHV